MQTCRFCHDDADVGELICPCNCKGSMKYVHSECLRKWRLYSGKKYTCMICQTRYHFSPNNINFSDEDVCNVLCANTFCHLL